MLVSRTYRSAFLARALIAKIIQLILHVYKRGRSNTAGCTLGPHSLGFTSIVRSCTHPLLAMLPNTITLAASFEATEVKAKSFRDAREVI
jgi:hypothetical protein